MTTTLWADTEFTGWVAPLANRMAAGQILYGDGLHMPLPPLSFVLVRVISGGAATWLTESTLNALFQAATLLILFAGVRRRFGFPTAFLALATAVPLFYSLPKSILYDSMAQCFAAATMALALGPWSRRRSLAVAATTALCIMTKQSTASVSAPAPASCCS